MNSLFPLLRPHRLASAMYLSSSTYSLVLLTALASAIQADPGNDRGLKTMTGPVLSAQYIRQMRRKKLGLQKERIVPFLRVHRDPHIAHTDLL